MSTTWINRSNVKPIEINANPNCSICQGTGWDENFYQCSCPAEAIATPLDVAELATWLAAQTWSEFAVSLAQQFADRGRLSERQIAAATSMRAKCEARAAARQQAAPAEGLDLSGMISGRYAVPGGDTRLKVQIDVVTKGNWEGWVFVKDAAEYGQGRRYGKQRPGGRYEGEILDALRQILADPKAAAAEYGRLTGTCGVCGRHLEDEESVARGIGPICWAKF